MVVRPLSDDIIVREIGADLWPAFGPFHVLPPRGLKKGHGANLVGRLWSAKGETSPKVAKPDATKNRPDQGVWWS